MKAQEVRDQKKLSEGKIEVLKMILQNINENKIDSAKQKTNTLIEAESILMGLCEGALANGK